MTPSKSDRPAAFSTASTGGPTRAHVSGENMNSTSANIIEVLILLPVYYALLCLPGTMKVCNGVSSGIGAFGRTNAPILVSRTSGLLGLDGFAPRMTLLYMCTMRAERAARQLVDSRLVRHGCIKSTLTRNALGQRQRVLQLIVLR